MDAASTIRRARREARLSLRSLAERAGTSHATLVAYEAGRVVPGVATLVRIVDAAGFTAEFRLAPRVDRTWAERVAKGDELHQALDLAAQFPARHAPELSAPVFGSRR